MSVRYYGPTAQAELQASELLNLDYSGREQDWELEFANPALVEPILSLMESSVIDFDVLCALGLLLIASTQECREGLLPGKIMERVALLMKANPHMKERMRFYWIDLRRADDPALVERMLGKGDGGS